MCILANRDSSSSLPTTCCPSTGLLGRLITNVRRKVLSPLSPFLLAMLVEDFYARLDLVCSGLSRRELVVGGDNVLIEDATAAWAKKDGKYDADA